MNDFLLRRMTRFRVSLLNRVFRGSSNAVKRYEEAKQSWRAHKGDDIRGVTEALNELVIAKLLLADKACASLKYEPELDGTEKRFDFRIKLQGDRIVLLEVKTIQPIDGDAWQRYERVVEADLFAEGTQLILSKQWLGGEIAHDFFAAREKFLAYTIETEQKIAELKEPSRYEYALAFCGNGFDWKLDQLEDFADFYRIGRHRADDQFAKMEAHYLKEKGIVLSKKVNSFCYLQRPKNNCVPERLVCRVHGPRFGA